MESKRPLALGLAAVATALAAGAAAQDLGNLRSAAFLAGTCERLVVAGADRSAGCHTAIVNLSYRDGRTSFAFTDNGGPMMVSFSGISSPAQGDRGRLVLDMVTRASDSGATVESEPIEGACDYSNPYAGPSYVRCAGTSASGEFSAAFTSNGEPPRLVGD